MKVGIIAGNRNLPLLLAQRIREHHSHYEIVAFAFKGETTPALENYVDALHWLPLGKLGELKRALANAGINQCLMIGQINPLRIFRQSQWDADLVAAVKEAGDLRPHAIFARIIAALEKQGIVFLDSTLYLQQDLAGEGPMTSCRPQRAVLEDISFGVDLAARFVELDVGQTVVVKQKAAVSLESLEGTDNTIRRAFQLAGSGCTVVKFSKSNQDMRFDVPVVGFSTLALLKRTKAASLVLERGKVIILDKERFLSRADRFHLPVVGAVVNQAHPSGAQPRVRQHG